MEERNKTNEIYISIGNIEYYLQDYNYSVFPEEQEIRTKIKDFCAQYGNNIINKATAIVALNWWEAEGSSLFIRKTFPIQYRATQVANTMSLLEKKTPVWVEIMDFDDEDHDTGIDWGFWI